MNKRFLLLFIFISTCLHAGWGPRNSVHTFEGAEWTEVFYSMHGVAFTGIVPNYDTAEMVDDEVYMNGFIDDMGYVIDTYLTVFKAPKSGKEFKKKVQEGNPSANIGWLNAKKLGATYAVEFTLTDDVVPTYWRIIYTNNQMIKLGTTDSNELRRNHFFNSFRIK